MTPYVLVHPLHSSRPLHTFRTYTRIPRLFDRFHPLTHHPITHVVLYIYISVLSFRVAGPVLYFLIYMS